LVSFNSFHIGEYLDTYFGFLFNALMWYAMMHVKITFVVLVCCLHDALCWTSLDYRFSPPFHGNFASSINRVSNILKCRQRYLPCTLLVRASFPNVEKTGLVGGDSMDLAKFLGLSAPTPTVQRTYEVCDRDTAYLEL
jgi:hypothetical protein